MALGTATVVKRAEAGGSNTLRADVLSFVGDDSYPAGGTAAFEAFVRTAVGRGQVEVVGVIPGNGGGYLAQYDAANDKLVVYESGADGTALDEVTAATDLSGTTFEVTVLSV